MRRFDRIERLKEDFEKLIAFANVGIDSINDEVNVSNIGEGGEFLDLYQCLYAIIDSLDGLDWPK